MLSAMPMHSAIWIQGEFVSQVFELLQNIWSRSGDVAPCAYTWCIVSHVQAHGA
jgi:hypothetical protein